MKDGCSVPLESVIEDVLGQAETAAKAKLKEAERLREETVSSASNEASSIREGGRKRVEEEAARLRRDAAREAQIEIMVARRSMMKRVLDQAYGQLMQAALSDESRRKHIAQFVRKASDELGKGTIHASPEDIELLKDAVPFSVKGDLKAAGGILAESADGSVLIDLTLDTLLNDFWQKNIALANGILFG